MLHQLLIHHSGGSRRDLNKIYKNLQEFTRIFLDLDNHDNIIPPVRKIKFPHLKFFPFLAILIFSAAFFGFTNGQQTRAYLAFTKHNYKEAFDLYTQVNDESGKGLVCLAQNNPNQAWTHFSKNNDQSGMGLCLLKKRKWKDAMGYFQNANDRRGMGLAYLGMHDAQKAKESFSKANDWSGMGLLYLAQNQYTKAEECFRKVADQSGIGLTRLKQKKFDEAEDYFTQARDDNGLGLYCLVKRNFEEAQEYFVKTHDLSGLGQVAMSQGKFDEAEKYFKQANDYNGLGDLYSQLHDFKKARAMFSQDLNSVKVIQSYRNDYTLPNKYEQAINYGKQALQSGRMAPEILMEMGDIYYEMKKVPEAIEALDEAMKYPGYASEAHLRKGRIYFYLRDLAKAKQEFAAVKLEDFVELQRFNEAQEALVTIASYESFSPEQLKSLKPAASF